MSLTGALETFALTDATRVKALTGEQGTGADALLGTLALEVSDELVRFMDRHVTKAARTEDYELPVTHRTVVLDGAPVDTTASFTIKYALDRDFNVANLSTNSYTLDPRGGLVELHIETPYDPGYVQVSYTGGMAASLTELEALSEFRGLVGAATRQVLFLQQRARQNLGGEVVSSKGTKATYVGEYQLLRSVRELVKAVPEGLMVGFDSSKLDTRAVLEMLQRAPAQMGDAIARGMSHAAFEVEGRMEARFQSGTGASGKSAFGNRSRDFLFARTGALAGSFAHEVVRGSDPLDIRLVSFSAGVPYARIQEGGGVITPVRAQYLTIPLPDNLTAAGVVRFPSARGLFENRSADRRPFFATSRAGNLVIGLSERGRDTKFLFLLKKRVEIPPRLGFEKTWRASVDTARDLIAVQLTKAAAELSGVA